MDPQVDVERARYNMVEQQIRPWEVLDQRVLDSLFELKREAFVPPQYRSLAFVDMEIPLGHGEKMLAPKMEARMLQELVLSPGDRILEVGTGSGYMTALLARFGSHVYSVDIVPEFTQAAAAKLASHGISNATLETGDAARGWERHAPYNAIVLTGSVPVLPEAFQASLAPGGRLLAIVGEPPVMEARLITCAAPGAWSTIGLFETCIAPLRNAVQPERFVF
jgi:protein-L-isoaspartate(D-aspartate) O-methyltransferase